MTSDVGYGQFGQAEYKHDRRYWEFVRHGRRLGVFPIADGRPLLRASRGDDEVKASPNPVAILRRFPELRSASSGLLHDLATESLAVEQLHPAQKERNQVLAFGSVAYVKSDLASHTSGYAVPAIAIPCGKSSEILRVIRLESTHRTFSTKKDRSVELLLPGKEVGYWVGGIEPILQIVFAEGTKTRGSLLAVRTRSQTQLFRPLWHPSRKPPVGAYPGCPYAASFIEVSPLVALTVAQTGGSSHADVCFDFRDQRKFAVVDASGRWTLFQLAGRHSEAHVAYHLVTVTQSIAMTSLSNVAESAQVAPLRRGTMTLEMTSHSHDEPILDWASPWYRCIVLEDCILVASSLSIKLFRPGDPVPMVHFSPSDLHKGFSEIRDVIMLRASHNEVGILTSRRVMHVRFRVTEATVSYETFVSWTHFRSEDDRDLELSCYRSANKQLYLIVYSSHSTTCSLFTVGRGRDGQSTTAEDPMRFHIPLGTVMVLMQQQRLRSKGVDADGQQMLSLLLLSNDLSLMEQHYFPANERATTTVEAVETLQDRKKHTRSFLSEAVVKDTDFIDRTSPGSASMHTSHGTTVSPARTNTWNSRSEQNALQAPPRTIDNRQTYFKMENDIQDARDLMMLDQSDDWQQILEAVHSISEDDTLACGTLYVPSMLTLYKALIMYRLGLARKPFISEDTEWLSGQLGELFQSQWNVTLVHLSLPALLPGLRAANRLAYSHEADEVTALYDSIIDRWISDVPASTPVQVRIYLSRLAAQVACEMTLASVLVKRRTAELKLPEEPTASKERAEVEQSTQEESPSMSSSFPNSQFVDSGTRDLPMTPEETPSITSGSSHTSRGPNPGDSAYERLRTLVDFEQRPRQLPARLGRVLDHWTTGEDPEDYDWTQVRREVEAKGERTLNKRAERRARRHLEKQRKEAERTMRDVTKRPSASQPVPRILPIRSSPPRPGMSQATQQPLATALESSQVQAPPAVVASQVSRGRHGARPQVPPVKKRRHGF